MRHSVPRKTPGRLKVKLQLLESPFNLYSALLSYSVLHRTFCQRDLLVCRGTHSKTHSLVTVFNRRKLFCVTHRQGCCICTRQKSCAALHEQYWNVFLEQSPQQGFREHCLALINRVCHRHNDNKPINSKQCFQKVTHRTLSYKALGILQMPSNIGHETVAFFFVQDLAPEHRNLREVILFAGLNTCAIPGNLE